jgi:hypothetical protein
MGMVVQMLKRIFIILGMVLTLFMTVRANVIINEVMSNEPDGHTSLEWIELYNNSDSTKVLSYYTLYIAGINYPLPGIALEPYSYLVVCKQAFASGSTPGFESYWGNYDGIWGNDSTENFDLFLQSGFTLRNDSGYISLKYNITVVSTFEWNRTGEDGVSWERYLPSSAVIANAMVPPGLTPGKVNSITPGDVDLALISLEAQPVADSLTDIIFQIANVGLNAISSGRIVGIYYDGDYDGIVDSADLIRSVDLPMMQLTDTLTMEAHLLIDGYYSNILIKLSSDDKISNNSRSLVIPGEKFPPVIISEFMADISATLGTEWVEIKNRSDSAINLKNWMFGDALRMYQVSAVEKILDTGKYLVLCDDSAAFRAFYSDASIPILQMPGWAVLNNDSDKVRLADNLGYQADSFIYSSTFGENYSWGRGETAGETDRWGRSVQTGGTPGKPNEIYYQPISEPIALHAEPDPFSLSRDHETIISFTVPAGDNLNLRIYDLEGRIVKTIFDNFPTLDGQVSWDGRSDGGRNLTPGIYILYLEVFGKAQVKKTIVVAP